MRGQPLSFAEWWPGVALQPGPFGAEIPVGTPYLVPDLLIAPLVAFDRGCWRLGYGGGFYDRSLVEIRATKPARAVGFDYGAQELDRIPREATDQRLDGVVTEAEVILPDG
ncbi:MAG: 5-formyltetrahydrofolate cyclo-ligase [Pseudomonadota bacterium]